MTSIQTLVDQRSRFLHFIRLRVDSPAAAEDILQTAYVRALEQISNLRQGESVTAWFYRILRNSIVDLHRRQTAEDRAINQWAGELLLTPEPHPETEQIACGCIASVIPTLRPAYRKALEEVDLAGASLELFAQRNSITVGNAAVRVHRARLALRKQLILVCILCARHACLDCTCQRPQPASPPIRSPGPAS